MIADAISFIMRQLMWLYQILMLALAPVFVLCACWALLNWHDPGLVHLKATWKAVAADKAASAESDLPPLTPRDDSTRPTAQE